ncbi:immunoglobulin-binding protein 1 [Octopus bimaculoides]|uniref:Immunoglobulin-binding protein 1 n=1 Tax=Octopus bimaculoides TaxID=37653 RepID=A0A0L8HGY7_OCTBM|nr:immunoglobulin-binding protein 1 [Octopus bimaculoides]|eukprot:XP_014772366.1 PREDICTED: immunoglobulin-binding protein 1-like [Octopus bimaculoides]
MAQNVTGNGRDTLASIFKQLLKAYEYLESSDLATSDPGYQQKVAQCIPEAEKAVHKVNLLHLFSDNEDIDEVTTSSLKFILLPALLGYFTMKQVEGERSEIVQKGKAYFKDFMRLCSLYKLTYVKLDQNDEEDEEGPSSKVSNSNKSRESNLQEMANQRQSKIERYKEQKKIIAELKELRTHVEKSHVEEEVERKYYMLLLKHWINTVIDEYENIKFELQILEQRPNMAHSHQRQPKEPSPKKSFRPFIITKDQLQKKVLGAGYPSLPTLTIEEFYDQKIKEGTLQLPTGQSLHDWAVEPEKTANAAENKEAEDDEKADADDPEVLAKARAWDDWKDDIRRGDGNRNNMG